MREYDKALAYIRKLSPYEVKQKAFMIPYAWLILITFSRQIRVFRNTAKHCSLIFRIKQLKSLSSYAPAHFQQEIPMIMYNHPHHQPRTILQLCKPFPFYPLPQPMNQPLFDPTAVAQIVIPALTPMKSSSSNTRAA